MLGSSAGFTDLEQLSLLALGRVTLHRGQTYDLGRLLSLYGDSFSMQSDTLVADIHEETLQAAIGTEAEAALDRFARQLATYDHLSTGGSDALWTAVTGYYAAFFVSNALLLACGRGFVRIRKDDVAAAARSGLYSVEICPGSTVGQLGLRLTPMGSAASHQATWRCTRDLLNSCAATAVDGTREALVFASLAASIVTPRWLSEERNDINYDFKRNPFLAELWPRELMRMANEEAIEDQLLASINPRPEQRFELVMAGCASLLTALLRRFVARGGKINAQRTAQRASTLLACPRLAWLIHV